MNLDNIDQLIDKMEKASLTELSYKDSDVEIKLKKGTAQAVEAPQQAPKQVQTSAPEEISEPVPEGKFVKAPMVGTFYKAASPEADPFIQVGDSVSNDSVVCILEAMKLFNEIQAETSGEIVEILVEDGDMVEYNQPLFRVR
ncbi:acetyl-CoA carboxylase biotin carboxyl carrier protein [Corticicoccus populi]|uniref:Biotin carboxyl carrier protein of acetyl-CoA carboxylase n=1 Tax=Corticicoccus populi TaxID=1812821 RepID=A0ABW5WVJ8_9STAP